MSVLSQSAGQETTTTIPCEVKHYQAHIMSFCKPVRKVKLQLFYFTKTTQAVQTESAHPQSSVSRQVGRKRSTEDVGNLRR